MFSGIVEEIGNVISVSDSALGRRLKVGAQIVTGDLKLGDSISVNGACVTAVSHGGDWFEAEASMHTLKTTTLGRLRVGGKINLERALKVSDRLGGHLVTGHVDGTGTLKSIQADGFSHLITFEVDQALSAFFVEKGSVSVDGVSLTVASLEARPAGNRFSFTASVIPHTWKSTTLEKLKVGDPVNIEADLIAKYVARWLEPSLSQKVNKAGLTLGFLSEHGYT